MTHDRPFHVAIPARSASTRLPNKPLLEIAGKPMLQWVFEHARQSGAASVVIAAGDEAVADCARSIGAAVWMTRPDHPNGTARLGELLEYLDWDADAIVVNVQADEPMLPPALIAQVAGNLAARDEAFAATLCEPLGEGDWDRAQVVKVWRDEEGYAEGFSRVPRQIEETRCQRHLGIYAYRAGGLARYVKLPPAPQELEESLEQCRMLHHGLRVHVESGVEATSPGVDTPEDLARVRAAMEALA